MRLPNWLEKLNAWESENATPLFVFIWALPVCTFAACLTLVQDADPQPVFMKVMMATSLIPLMLAGIKGVLDVALFLYEEIFAGVVGEAARIADRILSRNAQG